MMVDNSNINQAVEVPLDQQSIRSNPNSNYNKCCHHRYRFRWGICCCLLVISIVTIVLLRVVGNKKSVNDNDADPRNILLKQQDEYFKDMRLFLWSNSSLADLDILMIPNSPQKQALERMAYIDTVTMQLPIGSYRFLQRYALLVLYYSNDGSIWEFPVTAAGVSMVEKTTPMATTTTPSEIGNQTYHGDKDNNELHVSSVAKDEKGWGRPSGIGMNECDWGLVTCDTQERIIGLNFRDSGIVMTSQLPAEIGLLTNLIDLDLSNNRLEGSLPSQIFKLTNLERVDLSNNEFATEICTEIGQLRHLRTLSLSGNFFRGLIPETMRELNRLEELYIERNTELSGRLFDVVLNWPNISAIAVSSTALSGTLPKDIGILSRLQSLEAFDAAFTGTIPTEIGQILPLQIMSFSNMNLDGSIPSEIGNLVNLRALNLQECNLSGTLPTEFGYLSELVTFNIKQNYNLLGTVPTEIGLLSNLAYFQISNTLLSGAFPTSLRFASNLQSIRVERTSMTGTIPIELCSFPLIYDMAASCKNNISITCYCCKLCV